MSLAAAAILCAASAHADESGCISARYKAAGKYAGCTAKAAAKNFNAEMLIKCRQKYADAWVKLGAKYPGTSCAGARFVDNGDGTITDNLTQLIWEQKTTARYSGLNGSDPHDVDNYYTWSAVLEDADGTTFTNFLASLNSSGFAGQSDWRLPTFSELETLLPTAVCQSEPCIIDPLFAGSHANLYWSAATSHQNSTEVRAESFGFGGSGTFSKTDGMYVRAVRGGH